jgi:hypothetical protein
MAPERADAMSKRIDTNPKACGCGLVHDTAAWESLPSRGVQAFDADATGPAEAIELRNCLCGSTLAVGVEVAS